MIWIDENFINAAAPNANLADKLSKLGMPCFGCTPDRLPDLLAAVIKGTNLQQFADAARIK